jgi:glycosyltransferase involved in cell wall biosynthesis
MAVGTAVVCSDAPALVEVAGDAALIVARGDASSLADAIEAVVADETARAPMIAAGLVRSAGFTWDAVAERAWRLYRELGATAGR